MDGGRAGEGHRGRGSTSDKPDISVGEDSKDKERVIQDTGQEAILSTDGVDTGHSRRTSRAGGVGEGEDAIRVEHCS